MSEGYFFFDYLKENRIHFGIELLFDKWVILNITVPYLLNKSIKIGIGLNYSKILKLIK